MSSTSEAAAHTSQMSSALSWTCLESHLNHYGARFSMVPTLAALISSSAKHSAIVLMLRNAASRAPVHNNQMAWLTRLNGETSTAWRRTVPARPIRVESSRGPELMMAETRIYEGKINTDDVQRLIALTTKLTCKGFSPVNKWMISKACLTMRTDISFLPLLRPRIMSELVKRSTIGHCALRKRFTVNRPAEWGRYRAYFSLTAM